MQRQYSDEVLPHPFYPSSCLQSYYTPIPLCNHIYAAISGLFTPGVEGHSPADDNYKLLQSVDKMWALRVGYCLLTPGGGEGDMGLGQGSATQPPTHPTPPRGGGGSMPSTHIHIQADQN